MRALSVVLAVVLFACAAPPPATPAPPSSAASDAAPAPVADAAAAAAAEAVAAPDAAAVAAADASAPVSPLSDRAAACLDDPSCPAATADDLFRAADDAREPSVDCLRFADGDGTRRDLARARACLARSLASAKCDGSSAGLWQAELAIMLIDGVGGPVDVAGARVLFDGCFDDVTRQGVLEHADAREAKPATPPVSFCKDIGGTTLTGNECGARVRLQEETRGALQAKRIVAGMDDEGRRLFVAASRAYRAYVDAMGAYVYEVYRDGSIRNAAALGEEQSLLHRRTEDLATLATFTPASVSREALERSEQAALHALAALRAHTGTPAVKERIDEAEVAWRSYRDAETALYVHALAGRASQDAVERSMRASLNKRRTADLRADAGR
jgi:hypothetical protein